MTRVLSLSTDADHVATLAREAELAHDRTRRELDLRDELRRFGRYGALVLRVADQPADGCKRCRVERNAGTYRRPPGARSLTRALLGDHVAACVAELARRVHGPEGAKPASRSGPAPSDLPPAFVAAVRRGQATKVRPIQPDARNLAAMRRMGVNPATYWPEEPGKMPYDEWATMPSRIAAAVAREPVTVQLYGDREEVYRQLRAAGFADGVGS